MPFDDECNKFYIINLARGSLSGNYQHQALLYTIVDASSSTPTVTSTSGSNSSQLIDRFNASYLGGIAVSPKNSEGDRFLFCVAEDEVNRYLIEDNGISFQQTIANPSSFPDYPENYFELVELELYWDKAQDGTFEGRLGWGSYDDWGLPNTIHAFTIDLDESGNALSTKLFSYDELSNIVGFEFDNNGGDIFFFVARDNSYNRGVYYQDLSTTTRTFIQGSSDYWSHIELGRDGQMYIAENGSGSLASFDPSVTPYSISTSGLSNALSNYNVGPAGSEEFYTLPDQIDGIDNVHFKTPVSDFEVNNISLPTSYGLLPTFNICQPILIDDLTEDGNSYRVSLNRLDGSGNPISGPTQAWSSTLNTDVKSISYNFSFANLYDVNNTGQYRLKVEVRNACNVVDTKYGYFEAVQPLISLAPISINNVNLPSTTTGYNVYSCASQTVILDDNGWNGDSYRVKLQSTDGSGNVISGTPYLGTIQTSWYSNFSSVSNLKNLPVTNGNWLTNSSNVGHYKVTLYVENECGGINDFEGFIYLNAPPSAANMLLRIVEQGGQCSSQTNANQCITGNFSTGFSLGVSGSTFSTNNIEYYKRTVIEVDCATGNVIGSTLYQDVTAVTPSNPNDPITYSSLNGLSIGGSTGYFTNKFDKCYKLTVEVGNVCSSTTDWTFFKITDSGNQFRIGNQNIENVSEHDLLIYPNPVSGGNLNIRFDSKSEGQVIIKIIDNAGRQLYSTHSYLKSNNLSSSMPIDLSGFDAGLYFLSVEINGEVKINKFIKQ